MKCNGQVKITLTQPATLGEFGLAAIMDDTYTLKLNETRASSLVHSAFLPPCMPVLGAHEEGITKAFKGRSIPSPWKIGPLVLYPISEVGRGSYGRVLRALEVSSPTGQIREVAIKIFPHNFPGCFSREANAMTTLNGTGTFPQLLAAGHTTNSFYLVMVGGLVSEKERD